MRRKVITYFSVCGYEEDGTKVYKVLKWVCENKEEFEYAIFRYESISNWIAYR